MTRQQAIWTLIDCRRILIDGLVSAQKDYITEAFDMAIEALKREIPKNPVANFVSDSDGSRCLNELWIEDALLCPVCHSYVGNVFDELYCSRCGQKIVQKRVRVIV